MREVIRELRERFGWVISYEEGAFEEAHPARDPRSKGLVPVSPPMLFRVSGTVIANARSLNAEGRAAVIRDLVAQHSRQGGQSFRLTSDAEHLLPTTITENRLSLPFQSDGFKSPLDAEVSLQYPETYPHLGAAIEDVITQAARASGMRISVGTLPFNVVLNRKLLFDVPPGISARDALVSILQQVNADPIAAYAPSDQLTWELAYDPNSQGYFLSVVVVPNSSPKLQIIGPPDTISTKPSGRGRIQPRTAGQP